MNIIIIGNSGTGTVFTSTIEEILKFKNEDITILGYLNDFIGKGEKIDEYTVLGKTTEWKNFDDENTFFVYGLHSYKHLIHRFNKLQELSIPLEKFIPPMIHPKAYVSEKAELGRGVIVMPNSIVNPYAVIEPHVKILAGAFVGHHARIGEFSFLAAKSLVGNAVVEKSCWVGLNSTVIENCTIGEFSIVGAGSVVLKSVEPFSIVAGNPAKFIRDTKCTNI